MRGHCGLVFDDDRAFIAIASVTKKHCSFLQETDIPIPYASRDLLAYLRQHSEVINQRLKDLEKKHSLRIEKIFIELPPGWGSIRSVREAVPLKRRKKITSRDISFVKRYCEDKFLDWNDHCLHNIGISYEVEGASFDAAPLGIWGKKIGLETLLVWVKDSLYRETEDIFGAIDRNFAGFIFPAISMYASSFARKEDTQIVLYCGYSGSRLAIRNRKGFRLFEAGGFGLKNMYQELARQFLLTLPLAEEVFGRYISFKEIPYFKEVTIKKDSGYLNVSTQALNVFVKEYVKTQICSIIENIGSEAPDAVFSLIGRFNIKEGFYGFVKDYIPCNLRPSLEPAIASSSWGCLSYGVNRFLENDHLSQQSFPQRVIGIYREYF
jgi:cell division ATPase FtsA